MFILYQSELHYTDIITLKQGNAQEGPEGTQIPSLGKMCLFIVSWVCFIAVAMCPAMSLEFKFLRQSNSFLSWKPIGSENLFFFSLMFLIKATELIF